MGLAVPVGQTFEKKRRFSQADFDQFAVLSGDDNPIHVDPTFAARTRFGKTVAHGMLLYSTLSGVLNQAYAGALEMYQEMTFPTPTYVGELVTIQCVVTQLPDEHSLAELGTRVEGTDGSPGLEGRARLWLPGKTGFPAEQASYPSQIEDQAKRNHKGLEVGLHAQAQRTFTTHDLAEYIDLTSDQNPLFSDRAYAIKLGYRDILVPGGLLGGMFSHILGTRLPGKGTNWLKQKMVFPTPALPGVPITAQVEIIRLRPEKELVNLRTWCTDPSGTLVCDGEALVLVRDLEG
jgi:acyl dehydratase